MRLAIGDVHGRNYWKHYLGEDFSEFYILGDYFDSFNVSFAKQFHNFEDICKAAREDPRIRLCLGNHDYHYLGHIYRQQYSGFQERHYSRINRILEDNIDLLKVVYVTHDNYIISHAGVSEVFMKKAERSGVHSVEEINKGFAEDRNILTFDGIDNTGDDITQSPIWIRPRSLRENPVAGYNQIVGHTPVYGIIECTVPAGNGPAAGRADAVKLVQIDTGDREEVYRF
ncbi:MAG: metallophosphoesterase [Spirochaetaceae bacterium]|jgi:hypothetical protein|nr:metallophosphoesterase [Spirochaetaceae bacterium]